MDKSLQSKFNSLKSQELNIDLTRGKPGPEQLDLSNSLLDLSVPIHGEDGIDIRNYGEPLGIKEARELGSDVLSTPYEFTLVSEQSSLLLTYQIILGMYLRGLSRPWKDLDSPKFICPVPGFDRHFRILDDFNIGAIPVPLMGEGIDINALSQALESNDNVVGLICVPRHSNPSGDIFSDENIIAMLDLMKKSSKDSICIFDHAYLLHDFKDAKKQTPLWELIDRTSMLDRSAILTSFSKVTFAGGSIAFLAAGSAIFDLVNYQRGSMIVSPDKINQKRHTLLFKDKSDIEQHMKKHAEVLRPKFNLVIKLLKSLDPKLGSFKEPCGGYFISFNTSRRMAARTIEICSDLGVHLTPSGSTYPGFDDPNDNNIRLAPSVVSLTDIKKAMEVFKLALEISFSEAN